MFHTTGTSGTTTNTRTVTTAAQSKPPVVVISGSPIKLTPLSRAGAALGGAQTNSATGGNITCTLVHVQPFNAAAKQHIAPKAGGSPSKQIQIQKVIPISVAPTSLAKIQSGTTSQFTIAAPTGPTTTVRHIAPKVNIVSAVPSGQTVQLTTPSIQVRNIAPAEKPAQVPQQVLVFSLKHSLQGHYCRNNLLAVFSELLKSHTQTNDPPKSNSRI